LIEQHVFRFPDTRRNRQLGWCLSFQLSAMH